MKSHILYRMSSKISLLFLVLTAPLFGVYIGNPGAPAVMNSGMFSAQNPFIKASTGYIADYICNKPYEADQNNANFDPDDLFKKFIIHSQLASFSLSFLERLELFGTVGGSKPRAKLVEEDPSISDFLFDFESSYQFSWSAGGKIILMQWGRTYFCTDFTYFAIPESANSYFKFFNHLNLPISFGKQELSLNEWQISAALASNFFFLTPYGGGTYINSKLRIGKSPEVGSFDYKNTFNFGYFYGITLSLSGKFHLNFEQRFRNEKAYTFSTIAVF